MCGRTNNLGGCNPSDLVSAVIAQAVHDYKRLVDLGYIKNRGYSGRKIPRRRPLYSTYRCRRDIDMLCHFFWSGELESTLYTGLIDVHPEAVRRGLDEYERKGRRER